MTKDEASRSNGKLSKGPITVEGKQQSSQNSGTHGLFSKRLRFKNQAQRDEYNALQRRLHKDFAPQGYFAECLVDKIGLTLWQQSLLASTFRKLITSRGAQGMRQLKAFAGQTSLLDEPIPILGAKKRYSGRVSSLECKELHMKFTRSHIENKGNTEERERTGTEAKCETNADADQDRTEVEARLAPAIDSVLRCHSALENSLEKTLRQLREHQRHQRKQSRKRKRVR